MSVRDQIFTSAIAISAALACTPAAAQTEQRRGYQLEAQDLGTALRAVGRTSNSEIFFETNIVDGKRAPRSEEHTSELQSLMRISYAVFCLKKKKNNKTERHKLKYNKKYRKRT